MNTPVSNTVVVGGGVAGLAAAYYLQQQGVGYTLLEQSDRLGGLVQTVTANDCKIEFGPDAFITRKPWALELAHALGLDDAIIPVNQTPHRIYVLVGGRLVSLPDGLRLLVPTKFGPFLRSPLLSPWGKLRALLDWFIPAKADAADETLADFVRRRLGREVLDRLADPLLSGVYNAEMERQSILATFPQYRRIEAEHGSLIRGMRAAASAQPASTTAVPALVSFAEGMGQFIDALADSLSGEVRLRTDVTAVERDADGYRLTLDNGETLTAPALIMATPANVTAALLANTAPETAAELRGIRYEGVGSAALAYHRADVPRKLDAYGIVVPAGEGRAIDGMQWSSSKWPGRSPDDVALLRVFFGGPHTRYTLDYTDDELLPVIQRELHALLGITAEPLHVTVGRWRAAYPQYDVGHIERVARAEAALPDGLALAGNAYHGVGIPDTVHSAQQAVRRVLSGVQAQHGAEVGASG